MDRTPEFYLNEAKKNKKLYKELINKNPDRAQGYHKLSIQWLNLYNKKLALDERKNKEKRIQTAFQKGFPSNEDVRQEASELGINVDDNEEELNKELLDLVQKDRLDEEELKQDLEELVKKKKDNEFKLREDEEHKYEEEKDDGYNYEEHKDDGLSNFPSRSLQQIPPQQIPPQQIPPQQIPPQQIPPQQIPPLTPIINTAPMPMPMPMPTKNKTKKRRRKTPNIEGIEMTNLPINITKRINKLGFTESLKRPLNQAMPKRSVNPNICQNIFMNGSNINKKYFYPSEFPNITRLKPISVSMKRGGRKRSYKRKSHKKFGKKSKRV